MKKAFDQTVRDLKREVNKKVLKVPGIEQKVLDATSNEPWGPHGSLLSDIAQATRNYHEYQMIMSIIWKRINDTGKNWRHVYKVLTVLEYMVAHGSERVIDDIREHAYQISTLSDFQYIDSTGRDQGSNVRKKSQSLVVLVNDKERIYEVRQKAAANRDKFRNTSTGAMYRPSGGYGDRNDDDRYEGRYGIRDEDRNGYGRERDYGFRDDDRHGRNGDSYSRDGDRYGRDYDERYRDDDYRGRSRSVDDYQYGSRSRSSDRERAFDDDAQSSSRGSGARADDSQDGRRLERKFSEQQIGAPPSYGEAVSESRSPVYSERDGETSAASAPAASSSPASNHQSHAPAVAGTSASPANQEAGTVDEFDPRTSFSAAPITSTNAVPSPTTSNNAEMDLLGSLSESFSSNALAIMPATAVTSTSDVDAIASSGPAPTFAAVQSASNVTNQPFEDPFGDSPFKAIPSIDTAPSQQQTPASTVPFQSTTNQNAGMPQPVASQADTVANFGFDDSLPGITYPTPNVSNVQTPQFLSPTNSHSQSPLNNSQFQPSMNSQFLPQELSTPNQETDILADILPPSGPSSVVASQATFSALTSQSVQPSANVFVSFQPQPGYTAPVAPNMSPQIPSGPTPQLSSGSFLPQGVAPVNSYMVQTPTGPDAQFDSRNFLPQHGSSVPIASQLSLPQHGSSVPIASQLSLPSSIGLSAIVPQPSKDKFETKSTVWADTLSRGLVNLNISGPKTNPLSDIGIDFDALNRKEKRMDKQPAAPVTSTINMGKAMGTGSGLGRAGASALRPTSNPMMGSGMGMGVGPGAGIGGMRGYGGMNQPMGMGMNMNMNMGVGMGMNMGMGQGAPMQPQTGMPPGAGMISGYNPMMGTGVYPPQQPYGGGYR
ncbi:ENTH domain-containing protein [Cephalotus follicularis]|uniref:ENTH domain-containing protein n=1 Tax=Cephalotus follicularis TaxID=3775 RepID=A0A1Q3DDC7_CEPFO|nr:ENTH domain-containing protein [Cephalotus follicularis]